MYIITHYVYRYTMCTDCWQLPTCFLRLSRPQIGILWACDEVYVASCPWVKSSGYLELSATLAKKNT